MLKWDPNRRVFGPYDHRIWWMTSKRIGNLFHAPRIYACHFIAIREFKLWVTLKNSNWSHIINFRRSFMHLPGAMKEFHQLTISLRMTVSTSLLSGLLDSLSVRSSSQRWYVGLRSWKKRFKWSSLPLTLLPRRIFWLKLCKTFIKASLEREPWKHFAGDQETEFSHSTLWPQWL